MLVVRYITLLSHAWCILSLCQVFFLQILEHIMSRFQGCTEDCCLRTLRQILISSPQLKQVFGGLTQSVYNSFKWGTTWTLWVPISGECGDILHCCHAGQFLTVTYHLPAVYHQLIHQSRAARRWRKAITYVNLINILQYTNDICNQVAKHEKIIVLTCSLVSDGKGFFPMLHISYISTP